MAHYRATIQGQRGEASRLGTKQSGIRAHVNGWDIGVYVSIQHIQGHDVVYVSLTHGSHGGEDTHIGTYKLVNNEPKLID